MTHAMPTFIQFLLCVLIAYIRLSNEMLESVVVSTGIFNSANRCLRAMWSKWKGAVYISCIVCSNDNDSGIELKRLVFFCEAIQMENTQNKNMAG